MAKAQLEATKGEENFDYNVYVDASFRPASDSSTGKNQATWGLHVNNRDGVRVIDDVPDKGDAPVDIKHSGEAEFYAAYKGLQWILEKGSGKVRLLTDSKTVYDQADDRRPEPKNPVKYRDECISLIHEIKATGTEYYLEWISRADNDEADEMATKAAKDQGYCKKK